MVGLQRDRSSGFSGFSGFSGSSVSSKERELPYNLTVLIYYRYDTIGLSSNR